MDQELIKKIHDRKHYYENVEALESHLDRFFERDEITVFHEMLSLDFHLDVYFIQPKDRKYNLLITSGMSLLEMQVPEGIENRESYAFAELMLLLPKSTKFGEVFPSESKNDWIIGMMKDMARFPHHRDTFLTEGHTLQAWYDIAEPYDESTSFTSCLLLPSATFDEDFMEIKSGNRIINLYSLFPLYKNELEYKIQHGYGKLFDLLVEADVEEIFDNERPNIVD
ncbi:suppressor of fused domain protein [Sphingobacterium tabacisoli]|uniref:Suppressor of fused domain protein n=1 Tax=Sphingobacterium tabacisoli TaxID=2044855 RepID=A0ABW5L2P7_9SPHI|nr:suppressor of fused domain protein [Sphingobacterium tabacisoli]